MAYDLERAQNKFEFPEPPTPFELPYKGERLRWAIQVIGWDINQFADRLHMNRASLRQMLKGRRFIPDALGIFAEMHAQFYLSFPEPMGWHQKRGLDPDFDDEPENEVSLTPGAV